MMSLSKQAAFSNGSVVKVSVQPTTQHHHKRIGRVNHSHLAMPSGQGWDGGGVEEVSLRNLANKHTRAITVSTIDKLSTPLVYSEYFDLCGANFGTVSLCLSTNTK